MIRKITVFEPHIGRTARQELSALVERYDDQMVGEDIVHATLSEIVEQIPAGVVSTLCGFTRDRHTDALVLSDLPIGAIGEATAPTSKYEVRRALFGFEVLNTALAALLGIPVAYEGQQDGRTVNNICPFRDTYRAPDRGTGAAQPFHFHTEDAFLTYPPNYLQIACVRNPTDTPLQLSSVNDHSFNILAAQHLRRANFTIGTNSAQEGWDIERFKPTSLLSGSPDRPRIRYNAANIAPMEPSGEFVLESMRNSLQSATQAITLTSGTIAIVDNLHVCHARDSFTANLDGLDRWLLRIVSFRDMRHIEDHLKPQLRPLIGLQDAQSQ